MKKFSALLLIFVLVFPLSLFACDTSEKSDDLNGSSVESAVGESSGDVSSLNESSESSNESDTSGEPDSNESITESERLLKEIDDARSVEISQWSGVTQEAVDIYNKYGKMWDDVAEDYYQRLVSNDELREHIEAAKTNFDNYYNNEVSVYSDILNWGYETGTIQRVYLADRKYELKKEWALYLVSIYESFEREFQQ